MKGAIIMGFFDRHESVTIEQIEKARRFMDGERNIVDCTKPGDNIFWIEDGRLVGRHMSIKERIQSIRDCIAHGSWDCQESPLEAIARLEKEARETGEEI